MRQIRKELSNQESSDIRHLPQTVNFFLKNALPAFTTEKCSEAFILALRTFLSFQHLQGFLWRSPLQANSKIRIALTGDLVSFEDQVPIITSNRHSEALGESGDDLRITLHSTLRTIDCAPAVLRSLSDAGCKAAIEINFSYYGRPALWIAVGFPSAKQFPPEETKELLLVFGQCVLVSLHGAFHNELDQRDGKREKPTPAEQFDLALRWFHTVVRHLNVGLVRLQNNRLSDAEDALRRALIVSGVCLAELLSLVRVSKEVLPAD
jgi:hypothetical protein